MTTASDLSNISKTIVLVGAGKMGAAMLQGWLARGLALSQVVVIEPQPGDDIKALKVAINPAQTPADAAAIVIAVKPQVAGDVVPSLAKMADASTVAVSIMAGKTLGFLERALPNVAAVRAMPNTPAAIGRGITVAVPNARVSAAQRDLAHLLLAATGAIH